MNKIFKFWNQKNHIAQDFDTHLLIYFLIPEIPSTGFTFWEAGWRSDSTKNIEEQLIFALWFLCNENLFEPTPLTDWVLDGPSLTSSHRMNAAFRGKLLTFHHSAHLDFFYSQLSVLTAQLLSFWHCRSIFGWLFSRCGNCVFGTWYFHWVRIWTILEFDIFYWWASGCPVLQIPLESDIGEGD